MKYQDLRWAKLLLFRIDLNQLHKFSVSFSAFFHTNETKLAQIEINENLL